MHHETLVRNHAVEPRQRHQVLAAHAVVGAQRPNVGEVALQPVLDGAQYVRWCCDHRGPVVLERQMADRIYRLGICSQQNGFGVRELLPHHHLRGFGGTEPSQLLPQREVADNC
jgi:hypothetical protein